MSALATQGLVKSFGDKPVLSGLDLQVNHGSVTAILGPSGCGKTTLLRIVAGFIEPDAGEVWLGDRRVVGNGRSVAPQRRRVGYVPQEGALFPHLDVAANITFGLPRALRGGPRIGEMLELVELPRSIACRYPHELSGGQQQRVALARALAPDPAMVLLDEPFSSLDASLREGTGRSVVRALRAAGATAVLVTHDQNEALSLADRVGVMREGRLAQVGSPTEVYQAPVDPEIAVFVGGATVLPARVYDGLARCALGDLSVPHTQARGDAQVLIRPEQIQVDDGGEDGVAARVTEVSFYGHDAALRLDLLPSGPHVVARTIGSAVPPTGAIVRLRVSGPVTLFDPARPGVRDTDLA